MSYDFQKYKVDVLNNSEFFSVLKFVYEDSDTQTWKEIGRIYELTDGIIATTLCWDEEPSKARKFKRYEEGFNFIVNIEGAMQDTTAAKEKIQEYFNNV